MAHRGGLFYRPENSLAAFEHSISLGIQWAECDIRLARDNVPVLHHNDRIALPVGGSKTVRELDSRELARIDIGGGEVVPTLRELLKRFGGKMRIDLELKELDAVERVIPLLSEMRMTERVVISSFIPEALQLARDLAPGIPRGLLVDRLTGRIVGGRSAVRAALMLGCGFLLPHFHRLSREMVAAAREEGMRVIPWTVNQTEDARAAVELGVDGLISDRPDQFFSLIPNQATRVSSR